MNEFNFRGKAYITAEEKESMLKEKGNTVETLMYGLLAMAAEKAVTPVSGFNVGAVALGESGCLYFGANIEFEGMPLGESVHAEQAAITNAYLHGESMITAIAVNAAPCGLCRQFMRELYNADELRILVKNKQEADLGDLLPEAFGPDDLDIDAAFMKKTNNGIKTTTDDRLIQKAIDETNRSYAPYTRSYAGIALETVKGETYKGCYIENAAYNPSLKPLQCAIVTLVMHGNKPSDVKRGVLVENKNAKISHYEASRELLKKISGIDLEYKLLG